MKPKYDIGDMLRYGHGSTALFVVTSVSRDHAGKGKHRYYGDHILGGAHGSYEDDCQPATPEEKKQHFTYEMAYWIFDALRKRPGMPMSERDAFKATLKKVIQ